MPLSIDEVEHVARLARLSLTAEEKERFADQLSSILDYVDELGSLPTDGVEPLTHILPVKNVFRDDIVRPGASRGEILANGPLVEDGLYKVPKIL